MRYLIAGLLGAAALATSACGSSGREPQNEPAASNSVAPAEGGALSLTRLDCGTPTIKDFDKFFSDKPGLYSPGSRENTDSC
jgi:N-acyl homoserine lactone hydrolase